MYKLKDKYAFFSEVTKVDLAAFACKLFICCAQSNGQSLDAKTFPIYGIDKERHRGSYTLEIDFSVTVWGCVIDQRRLSKLSLNSIYKNMFYIWGE